MSEKLIVAISADIQDLKQQLAKANGLLESFSNNSNKSTQGVPKAYDGITSSIKGLVAGYVSLRAAQELVTRSFNESIKLDAIKSSFSVIFGSAEEGQKQFDRLKLKAEELGLSITSLTDSYKLFAGATTASGMSVRETNRIFDSVAKTAAVLKLSSEDAEGALRALAQMMGKGTVQAEELRGQLGERIPGAFKLAANAMGVTEIELGKMLEQGQVLAKDMLPKLADQFDKTFGNKVKGDIQGLSAEWERFKNKFTIAVEATNIGNFFADVLKKFNDLTSSKFWKDPIQFRADKAFEDLKNAVNNTDTKDGLNDLITKFNTIRGTLIQNTPLWKSYTNAIIEAGAKIKDLNKTTVKVNVAPQDLTMVTGAKEQIAQANELYDIYKQYPQLLSTMGAEYANNPFFRDLVNGDLKAKTDELTKSFNDFLNAKRDDTSGGVFPIDKEIEMINENAQNLVNILGSGLTSAFDAALISGQNFGQVLVKAIGDVIKKLLAALAVSAILSAILGGFGVAASSVGTGASLFGNIFKGLTGFNLGGGASGDKVSTAVATTSNSGSVSFEIRGDKLYGVLQNYQGRLDRLV